MSKQQSEADQPTSPFSSLETERKAHALTYPVKADGRGQARVYWGGKNYNFGEHDSDSSWLKFARWKGTLLETGKAAQVRSIRLDPAHERAPDVPAPIVHSNPLLLSLVAAVALVFGSCGTALVMTSGNPELVSTAANKADDAIVNDQRVPTELEKDVRRGVRMYEARKAELAEEASARRLIRMANYAKQGRANEPPNITYMRNKIAEYERKAAEDPEGWTDFTRGVYARRGIDID